MVRLGISQYGLWSSKEVFSAYKLQNIQEGDLIQPVLTWKTRVCQIKLVPAEHYIGYGCTYKTTKDTHIAILPIGYADGYDRGLSNRGYVLIRGKRAPILGRVCMNITIVDVTEITDVMLEDEVVLLGEQLNEYISADTLADLTGTINYEIVTRINWNIPKSIV
jgi:alanine racemase